MKLADTIDFGLFVWDEIMTGNRHMLPLIDSFKKEVSKYPQEMLALSFTRVCIDKIMSF
jgi:hypothetical protein